MTMRDIILRFFIGGTVVSFFAILGDIFRPKTFAGLFGAAPSVALATLGLTIASHGRAYAAAEARSMLAGAAAFFFYVCIVSFVLMRYRPPTWKPTLSFMPVWFVTAFGLWALFLR